MARYFSAGLTGLGVEIPRSTRMVAKVVLGAKSAKPHREVVMSALD
jgi:hypothetical protein